MTRSITKLQIFPLVLVVLLIFTACSSRQQLTGVDTDPADPTREPTDASASPPAFTLVEVTNGIYSFGNGNTFAAFMVTDEGVVVMDPINPDHASKMMEAIRSVTDHCLVMESPPPFIQCELR